MSLDDATSLWALAPVAVVWLVTLLMPPPGWVTPRRDGKIRWCGLSTIAAAVSELCATHSGVLLTPMLTYVTIISSVTDLWHRKVSEPLLYLVGGVTTGYYALTLTGEPEHLKIVAAGVLLLVGARLLTMFSADILLASVCLIIVSPALTTTHIVVPLITAGVSGILLITGFLTTRGKGYPAAPLITTPFLLTPLMI